MAETKIIKAINTLKEKYNEKDNARLLLVAFENALKIHQKFPPNHAYSTLEIFDKLLTNLSEEYIEVEEELKNCMIGEGNTSLLYEIADVIDYSLTITMVLLSSKEYEESLELDDFLYFFNKEITSIFDDGIFYDNVRKISNNVKPISQMLIDLFKEQYFENIKERRNWSNRKWHKPEPVNVDNDNIVKEKLIKINLRYIFQYMSILVVLITGKRPSLVELKDVFMFIYYKQNTILGLK